MSFPRYPAYQPSGVEWLGEVPKHWEVKPLWTFFRRVKRTGFEQEQLLSVYRDHGVVPKASRDDNFNKPSDDLSVYQLVVPGDLAINKMKAWQGSVAISEHRGIVSPAYFVYEALHNADSRYLHYLMRSVRYITGYLSVSKGIRVNQWDLEPQLHSRMPIMVPTPAEQTDIAAFLDRETGKIDELVAEQRRLMELLKEKRQAVISHAVTRGLNPKAKLKPSGIEWLGEVPEHWEIGKLSRLISTRKGIAFKAEDFTDEGVPVVKASDIKGLTIRHSETCLPTSFLEQYPKAQLKTGDLVLSTVGSTPEVRNSAVGQLGMVPEALSGSLLNQNTVIFTPSSMTLMNEFLFLILQTVGYRDHLDLNAHGTANQASINVSDMLDFFVPLPDLAEQKEISKFISEELAKFDTLTAEAQRAIDLLQERRTALISAAVTGQIDVRGLANASEP